MTVALILVSILAVALALWVWQLLAANKKLEVERGGLQKELQLVRAEHERTLTSQQKAFDHQLELTMEQLTNLSNELLERRSEQLSATNASQMRTLLQPLQSNLQDMQQTMERTRMSGLRNAERMEQQIRHVVETAEHIGQRADNLAAAIQGKNKMQGLMGESVLERMLERMGLKEGVNFTRQALLIDKQGRALRNTETDRRMVPDVLLHFPEARDVVVDAKVSLTAYVEAYNAETDESRNEALGRHVRSLRSHVEELWRKRYADYHYADHVMLPFVVMFVPYESALSEALNMDKRLWNEAFEHHVYIASEQTLYALLRLLEIAWQQQRQFEGQQQIMSMAKDMVERVGLFVSRMHAMGNRIEGLREEYDNALRTLSEGNRSILLAARRLTELGVPDSVKHSVGET